MSVWVRQGERWSDMKPFLIQNTLHCNDVFIFTLLPPPPLTPQHFRVCGEDSERRIGAADNLLQPEVPPPSYESDVTEESVTSTEYSTSPVRSQHQHFRTNIKSMPYLALK